MSENLLKKILIATDGSENAQKAAAYGIDIAKVTGAQVYALYVVSTEHAGTARSVMGWTDAFEEYLANKGGVATAYVEKLGKEAGVKVEPLYLKGVPAEKILEYAEESDIDLIVMGTQGLTGVQRFLIGSVAENVLRHSKVPVMIIR
ncbi:Universal stress protein [Methanosarcina siciliae C2J]|uniref:Universal stress protein n=3 Tax=Methanosarcina siciliae TaxID=38027 RepID=A0A0E3PCI6_9EURY|nr:universal stress protein [Methanosarcina siciliae]AKB28249.1 Universal stress protein [Methanosarcina siciliae T4/M]AKB32164.1 Universal stress protein [Methanosarcina siciliae HI350]AKB36075.1 Universal stress protein [Methanosarcina siciliae C2J]